MIPQRSRALVTTALLLFLLTPLLTAATVRTDHVTVTTTDNITPAQAQSIANVVEAARSAAISRYTFTFPDRLTVNVNCDESNTIRLFTDGDATINLLIKSPDDLLPPRQGHPFNLYGLCHELGHIAMYRLIPKHDFLTTEAAEGFAHYFGSTIVDDVHAAHGDALWWSPYNYKEDGTARLTRQLAALVPNPTNAAAGFWQNLAGILGEKNLPALFAAWGKLTPDPRDPAATLKPALLSIKNDPAVTAWWTKAQPLFVIEQPASTFTAATLKPAQLTGKPKEIALDDGASAGKLSSAGAVHTAAFDAPTDSSYLTAVRIFASRYGAPQPPAENFTLSLCDESGQVIRQFEFPYSLVPRGDPKWITLPLRDPTKVPPHFTLAIGFNPTATKGVFLHHDAALDHDSRIGALTNKNKSPAKADWLLRPLLDHPK